MITTARKMMVAVAAITMISGITLAGPAQAAGERPGKACTKAEVKKSVKYGSKGDTLVCTKGRKGLRATYTWKRVKFNAFAGLSGNIRMDGSSTVTPLMILAAEDFQKATDNKVRVTVATSGTGGGFEKFCNDETDISMASRPIKASEAAKCKDKGIGFTEVIVSNDGLAVIVNPKNDWATCLTLAELKKIWEPAAEKQINNWSQVREGFPNVPLVLFGAGSDSGTFDFFTEHVNGKGGVTRKDYNPTEDDNVTVNGVASTRGALGYYGLSYALENPGKNKVIGINDPAPSKAKGCASPTTATVQDYSYSMARPLFVYTKNSSVQKNPAMAAFVKYYLDNSDKIAKEARFVPLTAVQKKKAQDELALILKQSS